jgi:hypothetical protein
MGRAGRGRARASFLPVLCDGKRDTAISTRMGAWRDSVTGVQPQQELAGRTGHPERAGRLVARHRTTHHRRSSHAVTRPGPVERRAAHRLGAQQAAPFRVARAARSA